MVIVAFSGTPGTGKTTLAQAFARKKAWEYMDLGQYAKSRGLYDSYDLSKRCYIIDTNRLNRDVLSSIKPGVNMVIDSHLSHYLPSNVVKLCVITTCSVLKELERRLKARDYGPQKVRENLDAEIFKVCQIEATESGHKILVLDTCQLSTKECLEKIEQELSK